MHVIDLDSIDVSNLNRQFLFRMKDVGRPKATVAAEFIMKRVPACRVTAYQGKIQSYDESFYRQFNVVIGGLDNLEARRWINSLLVGLVQRDADGDIVPESVIPLIDGGTEGFKGQARLIIPKVTSCFECSLDLFPPQKTFPLCTIAETPRMPEHCVTYVSTLLWPQVFPDKKLDTDSPEDMQWVYHQALERANRYGIQGVTYFKTIGVVKNIIPAVASTNALIAAACVNETLKIITYCGQSLNNYLMFMGTVGVYSSTFVIERKPECPVCCESSEVRDLPVSRHMLLSELISYLRAEPSVQLPRPSLVGSSESCGTLYMQSPPSLEAATRSNLTKPLGELIPDGEIINVTDPTLRDAAVHFRISFSD